MYVCTAGHMAIRKARTGKKGVGKNQKDTYYFEVEICKHCPLKNGCYKEGAAHKTYSVSMKSDEHSDQMAFQETKYFKEKAKERYKIEAKNSELKHRHLSESNVDPKNPEVLKQRSQAQEGNKLILEIDRLVKDKNMFPGVQM